MADKTTEQLAEQLTEVILAPVHAIGGMLAAELDRIEGELTNVKTAVRTLAESHDGLARAFHDRTDHLA